VSHQSCGQPWLVNAVAAEVVDEILAGDLKRDIGIEHVKQAIEQIITRRDTHIDSLLMRLSEERVRKVIEPMIVGKGGSIRRLSDDYDFVRDLGLIREEQGVVMPANPIYAEVIGRALSYDAQHDMLAEGIGHEAPFYVKAGRLDMRKLLTEFQSFWRENSEIWGERWDYREAAPHLIVQAFLQRVVNGGGRIIREFAAGRRRDRSCGGLLMTAAPFRGRTSVCDMALLWSGGLPMVDGLARDADSTRAGRKSPLG